MGRAYPGGAWKRDERNQVFVTAEMAGCQVAVGGSGCERYSRDLLERVSVWRVCHVRTEGQRWLNIKSEEGNSLARGYKTAGREQRLDSSVLRSRKTLEAVILGAETTVD